MLHHPSKHHPNSISHFLALHHTAASTVPTSNGLGLQMDTTNSTHLDTINSSIGKSFTIAAILGLKKNASAAMDAHHNQKDFAVMNLSMSGSHHNHNPIKTSLMENMNNSRAPLAFGQHINQQHHHHHHHSSSALQSLQQQFQQQHQQHQQQQQHHNNQNIGQFHVKERSKGGGKYQQLIHQVMRDGERRTLEKNIVSCVSLLQVKM